VSGKSLCIAAGLRFLQPSHLLEIRFPLLDQRAHITLEPREFSFEGRNFTGVVLALKLQISHLSLLQTIQMTFDTFPPRPVFVCVCVSYQLPQLIRRGLFACTAELLFFLKLLHFTGACLQCG
jgi:hypothetical protein